MKALTLLSSDPLELHCSPDSAIISRGNPWFIPEAPTTAPWQARLFAAAVIHRLGRCIAPRFASRYYDSLALCAHFDCADAPRCVAYSRDGALLCGDARIQLSGQAPWPQSVLMKCGPALPMPTPQDFDMALSTVSQYITLRTGDLILIPMQWPPLPITIHADLDFTDTNGNLLLRIKPR